MVGIVSVPGSSLVGDPLSAFQRGQSQALGIQAQRQQLAIQQAQAQRQEAQAQAEAARQQQLQGLLGRITPGQQPRPQLGTQPPQQAVPLGELGQPSAQAPAGITPIAPPDVSQGGSSAQAMAQLAIQFPERFEQVNRNLGLNTQRQKDEASDFAFKVRNTPFDQREPLIQQRISELESDPTRNARDTRNLRELSEQEQNQALDAVQVAALSPKERIDLAEGRREAGTLGEEVSEVQRSNILPGGLVQIVRKDGTVETIPANEADETLIQAAEQRGAELQGLRAGERGAAKESIKQGAQAFEDSVKIRKNVRNLNEGIRLIDGGAKTGRVEKLLPSIRTASVELDNLQQRLGLDVIGSVTFGALSEGELNLALSTALPTGLDEPALRDWLVRKRDAQTKLLAEVEEAAIFLSDPENNITDFITSKKDVGVDPVQLSDQDLAAQLGL